MNIYEGKARGDEIPFSDERLTPEHHRSRSGSTMIFYTQRDQSDSFEIKAPRPEFVAEINECGNWFWRNDCPSCNGKERRFAYVECDEHNICFECGISRKAIKESVWGTSKGWCCNACMEKSKQKLRDDAFAKLDGEEPDTYCMGEIICPHCGSDNSNDDIHEDGDMICDVCDGQFKLKIDYTIDYTTKIIGERLTK